MRGSHLKISQDAEQLDSRHWRWSVWVEGPSEELDEVMEVVYLLHPTFKNPIRAVSDRSTNFLLSSSGWGQFTIVARLKFQDGTERDLEHFLRFGDATSERRKATVFLSYGIADSEVAKELASALSSKEIEVVDASSEVLPGASVSSAVTNNIDNADAVVAVMRSSTSSSVFNDAGYALQRGKPVIWYADADSASVVADAAADVNMAHDEREVLQKVSQVLASGGPFSK